MRVKLRFLGLLLCSQATAIKHSASDASAWPTAATLEEPIRKVTPLYDLDLFVQMGMFNYQKELAPLETREAWQSLIDKTDTELFVNTMSLWELRLYYANIALRMLIPPVPSLYPEFRKEFFSLGAKCQKAKPPSDASQIKEYVKLVNDCFMVAVATKHEVNQQRASGVTIVREILSDFEERAQFGCFVEYMFDSFFEMKKNNANGFETLEKDFMVGKNSLVFSQRML
jgi:hypothetical protein